MHFKALFPVFLCNFPTFFFPFFHFFPNFSFLFFSPATIPPPPYHSILHNIYPCVIEIENEMYYVLLLPATEELVRADSGVREAVLLLCC